jgi:opacity protein-like surface antigen
MIGRKVIAASLAALALAACAAAWAQPEPGKRYVGAAVGVTKMHNACASAPSSLSCGDRALKFFGGYQFTRHLGLELAFNSLGSASASSGESADLMALDASAIASWPLANRFAIYGRLGVYYGQMDAHAAPSVPIPAVFPPPPPPPTVGWQSGSNTGATFGLGASYEVTYNGGFRLEWQRFSRLGGSGGPKLDVDVLSFGLRFRF